MASDPGLRTWGEDAWFLKHWLGSRPAAIKDLVACRAEHCSGAPDFGRCMDIERRLFFAAWPADFGYWCLTRALAAKDRNAAAWFVDKVASSVHGRRQDVGLSRPSVERRLAGNSALRAAFAKRLSALERDESMEAQIADEQQTTTRRRQREWRDRVKSYESSLRDNRCPPKLLRRLAQVYFNEFVDVHGDTPLDRLRDLLNSDHGVIDAVLKGFRGSIRRSDIPTHAEILRLRSEGRIHQLAFPILALLVL